MATRRSVLAGGATLTLLAPFARLATAATNPDSRFVLVILRGGLDGLAAVPPYAEPAYAQLRGPLALSAPGTDNGALDLDGTFGLHPALANLHAMYRAREALVLHAAATPYRERSHFDAQNVLEAGSTTPSASGGGWLNRALAALDSAGDARGAVALADSVPLVLRGELAVTSWAPSQLPEADEDTLARVRRLYEAADPALAESLNGALEARAIAGDAGDERMGGRGGQAIAPLASAAARFLASAERAAHRRARRRRMGHAREPRRRTGTARAAAARPRRRLADAESRARHALARDDGARRHRVRAHGRRSTARAARTTARRAARSSPAAPSRAAASSPIGRGSPRATCTKAATCARRRTCASLFKAVLHERFGVSEAALARTVFPASDSVEPLAGVTA